MVATNQDTDETIEKLGKLNIKKNVVLLDSLTVNNVGQFKVIAGLKDEPLSTEVIKYWIGLGAQLAYFNDVCCGCVCWKQANEVAYLLSLATLPAYRNQKVGSMLLQYCIDTIRSIKPNLLDTKPQFIDVLVASCAETAIFFKHGFVCLDQNLETAASSLKELEAKPAQDLMQEKPAALSDAAWIASPAYRLRLVL
ncbi:hypothetical protein HDV03_000359 [Kappamyces sp. JEL0829]|nr:hypothetical protein HDV03_000359 [Kappamyces sp. JEL0829]